MSVLVLSFIVYEQAGRAPLLGGLKYCILFCGLKILSIHLFLTTSSRFW